MKHALGKKIVLLLLLVQILFADSDFSASIKIEKNEAYLKEGLVLQVDLNQTDPEKVLLFQFEIPKSPDYTIVPIEAKHDDTLHKTTHHNIFLVYPLKTGEVSIPLHLIKRVTDDEKVAHFASGDRDDFKKLETKDIPIHLDPIILHVKPLPIGTQLTGDFNLTSKITRTHAQAYEPIPLHLTIQGIGFPPLLETPLHLPQDVTLFEKEPHMKQQVSKHTMHYSASYNLALSATDDFELPAQKILAFNPKTEHAYTLTIEAQHFSIEPADTQKLIDTEDTPPTLESFSWENLLKYGNYLLLFITGFFTGTLMRQKRKKEHATINPLCNKITQAQDLKTLLQLLIAQNDTKLRTTIHTLENSLYGDGKITLKEAKKQAKESLCTLK